MQVPDDGRSTPLPQYQKTQSVPFNLTLQEDKKNPGQFQLVVDIDPENKQGAANPPTPAASKKLYTSLQAFPSLGYNVSPLYQTQESSPPTSPQHEKGWSDLDAIPSDFLKKVVPDWEVTFQRKDSTASTQSRRLADIKARIKKSGKGFVVRLLKGSTPDANEVAEVHLGQGGVEEPEVQELDSCPQAELDAIDTVQHSGKSNDLPLDVFELGTSSGASTPKLSAPAPALSIPAIPHWLNQASTARTSISEEGFSDAETLTQEVRSIRDHLDDDPTDLEPFSAATSKFPTRTASVTSIVKTPTRGLSVVGPVKRINKQERNRVGIRGKSARSDLNRSDAKKSFKRRSSRSSSSTLLNSMTAPAADTNPPPIRQRSGQTSKALKADLEDSGSDDPGTWPDAARGGRFDRPVLQRRSSTDEPRPAKQKARLRLQTNVPRTQSANSSPVMKRKPSHRMHKRTSSSSSVHFAQDAQYQSSPTSSEADSSEADSSEALREALKKAFRSTPDDAEYVSQRSTQSLPRIEEPIVEEKDIGAIPLPSNFEIQSPLLLTRNSMLTFWGLALSALSEKALQGLHALRNRYGSEPLVPPNHVRVRWTCSCGEPLYDDFIEKRPGAARLLEAYLNRPRAHTPTSPTSRTSTSTSTSSVFSSASRASTLATPASTYGGFTGWGKNGDSSKLSPSRVRSSNPFSVRIGGYPEEQWLLTCANEGRFTPKIVHLDVNVGRVKSDKDLALALREHYEQLNGRWLKWARLRGLTTIEFVQVRTHISSRRSGGKELPPPRLRAKPATCNSFLSLTAPNIFENA
jgi:hypothetical protein